MTLTLRMLAAASAIAALGLTGASGFVHSELNRDGGREPHIRQLAGSRDSGGSTREMLECHYGLDLVEMGRLDTSLARLIKERLAITEDQEPAWQAYVAALDRHAETLRSLHDVVDRMHDPQASQAERQAVVEGVAQPQRRALQEVHIASEKLARVLTDGQKQEARALVLHGAMIGQPLASPCP